MVCWEPRKSVVGPSPMVVSNCPGTPRWCPGTPSERRSVGEFALEKLAFRSLARPQAAFCGTTWAVTIFLISGAAVAMQADGDHGDAFTDVIQAPSAIACPEAILGLPSRVGIRTVGSATLVIVPIAPLRMIIEQDAELARRFLSHALREMYRLQAETC